VRSPDGVVTRRAGRAIAGAGARRAPRLQILDEPPHGRLETLRWAGLRRRQSRGKTASAS
jgi:hypothetical protein